MASIGLLEISSKSVKYIYPGNGKLVKRTHLLINNPMTGSHEEIYAEIKNWVKDLFRNHKKKCILTGSFTKEPLASFITESLTNDFSGMTVTTLSTREQLDYSYYSFIDEEKKHSVNTVASDIFVEITDQALLIGQYRDGENVNFKEAPMGIQYLRNYFDDAKGNASSRYLYLQKLFRERCIKDIKQLDWKIDEGYRVIFAGGASKALVGGQDVSKKIQGKIYSTSEIAQKVETKLENYSEEFEDKPEAIWKDNHFAKLMSGILASIYVGAIMESLKVDSACFSGFGTIDSYFYRVVLGKRRHFRFPELLRALKAHQNVFLCGPAGSGKTTAAKQCALKLKFKEMPEKKFYFTGAISNEYKLLGYMDANGRYVSTEFRKAYENGGVFLFDEVDASSPQPLLAFNAALSGDQMDFPDKPVPKHEDFYCIATANTYGSGASRQYVGRNQLDAAFLDRFVFIDWPYDEELEKNMTDNAEWAEYVQNVRHAIDKLGFGKMGVRHIVSPRATESGAALLEAGIDRKRVEEMVIWKGLERETVQMIKNNMD